MVGGGLPAATQMSETLESTVANVSALK